MELLVCIQNKRGQTTVEWLLLMAVAFLTAYFIMTGPFATFTTNLISNIKSATNSIVRNGEVRPDTAPPDTPARLKAVHL